MRWSGARPVRIIWRSAAFWGSSNRRRGPSSTLKPSSHRCRMRVWVSPGSAACGRGSGMTWDGVSSPPRVCPLPRNRLGGADDEASPPGREAFLQRVSRIPVGPGNMYVRSGLLEDVIHNLSGIISVRGWILNSQSRFLPTSKQVSWLLIRLIIRVIVIIIIIGRMAVASMSSSWTLIQGAQSSDSSLLLWRSCSRA